MTTEAAKLFVLLHKPEAEERTHMGMIEILTLGPGGVPQVLGAGLSHRGAWNAAAEALKPGTVIPFRIDGEQS